MKKTKYLLIVMAFLLTGCSQAEETKNVPVVTSETTTVSVTETQAAESEAAETEITAAAEDEYTPVIAEDGEHIIYWTENGTEKSEVYNDALFPDGIIQKVIANYIEADNIEAIYAADWVINTYYEEVENEAGPARNAYNVASLDLCEGYSAYVGEELLNEITESIGKSLMENYNIRTLTISEMRETITQIENN